MRPLGDFGLWLADQAALPMAELHESCCQLFVAGGLPIWRAVLGTETLHPEEMGGQFIWLAEGAQVRAVFYHGVETTPSYLNSPLRVVDETQRPFRRRLDGPPEDMPLLRELQESGASDYLMVPLPFLDRTRSASLSFATLRPTGFTNAEIEWLEGATRLISPYAERRVLRRIAIDLLDTYIGRQAGERIFNGQVKRGAVDTIDAAILMADLRGFTAMSNQQSLTEVVETLDAWFESVAAAIEAHGGEILKFMGDGLLAIFSSGGDSADSCRRAASAALEACQGVDALNTQRTAAGQASVEFVVGLHVGEVGYGNIGGRRRLDFTVLGPAVNYASRVQDLAKNLGGCILLSRKFSELISAPVIDLGDHPLRSIGEAERIFELPRP